MFLLFFNYQIYCFPLLSGCGCNAWQGSQNVFQILEVCPVQQMCKHDGFLSQLRCWCSHAGMTHLPVILVLSLQEGCSKTIETSAATSCGDMILSYWFGTCSSIFVLSSWLAVYQMNQWTSTSYSMFYMQLHVCLTVVITVEPVLTSQSWDKVKKTFKWRWLLKIGQFTLKLNIWDSQYTDL